MPRYGSSVFIVVRRQLIEPFELCRFVLSPVEQGQGSGALFLSHLGESFVIAPSVGERDWGLVLPDGEINPGPFGHRPPAAGPEHVAVIRKDAVGPRLRLAPTVLVSAVRYQSVGTSELMAQRAQAIGGEKGNLPPVLSVVILHEPADLSRQPHHRTVGISRGSIAAQLPCRDVKGFIQ